MIEETGSKWTLIEPTIEYVNKQLISLMEQITVCSKQDIRLPQPKPSFCIASDFLKNAEYNIVVCGEVKKGKSTLLNAIIGENILPVENEIATSQVFRISHSDTKSYQLIFKDGNSSSITKEELSLYGSQVQMNATGGVNLNGKELAYIQINTPISFLPKGVSLVDTPGLGAIYHTHELITQQYINNASAVLFVIDPERPIVEQEKTFINKILDITPHVMYVMTKIDKYSPEDWSKQLQRNEELLLEIYQLRNLSSPEIFPISSKSLYGASNCPIAALKQANYINSQFPILKDRLLITIQQAVGLLRSGIALTEIDSHISHTINYIDDLANIAIAENETAQTEIKQCRKNAINELNNKWSLNSSHRQNLSNEISAICNSLNNRIQHLLSAQAGARLYEKYTQEIEALTSIAETKEFAETFSQKLTNEISSICSNMAAGTERKVMNLLSTIEAEINNIGFNRTSLTQHNIQLQEITADDKFNCYRTSYINSSMIGGVGGIVLAGLGVMSAGVALVIGIGAVFAGIFGGLSNEDKCQLARNKQELTTHLKKMLNKISAELLLAQGNDSRSKIGEFTFQLKQQAESAITKIFEQKSDLLQQQIQDLDNMAKKSHDDKEKEYKHLMELKNNWERLLLETNEIINKREDIITALS